MKRTHYCGQLRSEHINQKVNLYGWMHSRRDHGGVIFIDLRDREGIVQIVFSPESKELFSQAEKLRLEYVLDITGHVRHRPEGTVNPKLPTGEVEVVVETLNILNTSLLPPFEISDYSSIGEDLRLKHRYLDLRQTKLKENLILRSQAVGLIRKYFSSHGFIDIETPFLTKSTPEGARDFLVPSRLGPGTFYALPQSPQLFKQILMIAGLDRYYQIVRCFRDEDLRADRQPEFTQIDLEMSFVEEEDIIKITENMLNSLCKELLNMNLSVPFPRMTYTEAMSDYGTDRPDTRYGMKLVNLTDVLKNCKFKVFNEPIKSGGKVKSICVLEEKKFSRQEIDNLVKFANSLGAKGLAWMRVTDSGIESPIKKYFTEQELKDILSITGAKSGSILFFVADKPDVVDSVLANLRIHLAQKLNLVKCSGKDLNFVWVTDFPLFEWSEKEKRIVSRHHPFTAPQVEDAPQGSSTCQGDEKLLSQGKDSLLEIKSRAYDLVVNGIELGGGSIRIHKRELQEKIFKILNIPESEARDRFGFILDALDYGAPPHGGIALGLDRLIAILIGEESIREVIAFPKTQKGTCPLTNAPDKVTSTQLKELHIKTN